MGSLPLLYFNAVLFVYQPNLLTYFDLLDTVKITTPTLFAKQDFLNHYFKDIYKPIPNVYNLVLAMLWRHPENVNLNQVKVVHYCANGLKPWMLTGNDEYMDMNDIKMLVKKWWEIYEDESLDYINTVPPAPTSSDNKLFPFLSGSSDEGWCVAHQQTVPSAA
ncbi:hypothetical protein QYF36_017864 [Acer negundo]|nr:hypothetical protein QYF36_017864 [Acer negundo]